MGKRIIQQARGHGSLTYRVRKKAFKYKIKYPRWKIEGEAIVMKLVNSPGHSAPLAKIKINKNTFYNVACEKMFEGQKLNIGEEEIKNGNILQLENIPIGTKVYNIEARPGDGGRFIRAAGTCATVSKKIDNKTVLIMSSKRKIKLNNKCRATIGVVSGAGRLEKPLVKAGKKYYLMKAKSKLWPRTSAVKMNVIDHPFGSGRGKNISHGNKGKIPKRNAPPGAKVGLLRPRRTGRRKGKRRVE